MPFLRDNARGFPSHATTDTAIIPLASVRQALILHAPSRQMVPMYALSLAVALLVPDPSLALRAGQWRSRHARSPLLAGRDTARLRTGAGRPGPGQAPP